MNSTNGGALGRLAAGLAVLITGGLVLGACGSVQEQSSVPRPTESSQGEPQTAPGAGELAPPAVVTKRRPTLLAVGDIGECRDGGDRGEATAGLAANLAGPIQLLGDIAYPDGTQANYDDCFWPAWSPLLDRTRAAIGNHDDRHRSVFYANWPTSGTSAQPWYSYSVGSWRVLVVDANCTAVSCSAGAAQTQWLKRQLAANKARCTVLAMHQPRFSSDNEHGNDPAVDALWRVAYTGGIDLVIAGHAHDYERIGPVGITGRPDAKGPTLLVVGTGGTALRSFAKLTPASTKRIDNMWGMARLTLRPGTWTAQFLAAPSGELRDQVSGGCR